MRADLAHAWQWPLDVPCGAPQLAHLRGRLTRKAKATVSRKLKMINLYNSSPTEFSQHWGCRGKRPITIPTFLRTLFPQPPLVRVGGGLVAGVTPKAGRAMHLWGVVQGAPWGYAVVWHLCLQLFTKRDKDKDTGLQSLRWGFVGKDGWPPGIRRRCSRRSRSWSCFCLCTAQSDPARRRTSLGWPASAPRT